MKCLKINRRHIFFIATALAMQAQCSAMEQVQERLQSSLAPMRAATELVGDLAHTVTYYSRLKEWFSDHQEAVELTKIVVGFLAVCGLCALGVGVAAGDAYVLEVVLPTIGSVVGKFVYGVATLIPQFMMSGFKAASHSAGSIILYAFENALTTLTAAGACFAGWKLGDFVAKRLGISPTDDPKAHTSMCILGALLGLVIPVAYMYWRTKVNKNTKEARESKVHDEEIDKVKARRIDGGRLSITVADHNAAWEKAERPKAQKHLIAYVVTYIVCVACVIGGGVGASVAWNSYKEEIIKEKEALLLKLKEEKDALLLGIEKKREEIWVSLDRARNNDMGVHPKPMRNPMPVVAEEEEEEGDISELEQEAPQLEELTIPLDESRQNESLLGRIVPLSEKSPYVAKTPKPTAELDQRLSAFSLEHRMLGPSAAPLHPNHVREAAAINEREGAVLEGIQEDDDDSKMEELLPEQTPELIRSLYDPHTKSQYTSIGFLMQCLEVGHLEHAEWCIRKYSSDFQEGVQFDKSYFERDRISRYQSNPSLLGRTLLVASREGYMGLATLIFSDVDVKKTIPFLLDKKGYNVIQLAVIGGHGTLAKRLSGMKMPTLVDDALKKGEVYNEAKAAYDKTKVAAQTERKEAKAEAIYNEAITTAQLKRDQCAEYVNTQAKAKARAELAKAMWDFETGDQSISARGEHEKALAKLREIRIKHAKYIVPIGGAAIWLSINGRANAELKKARAAWDKSEAEYRATKGKAKATRNKAKATKDKAFAAYEKANAELKKAQALAEIERVKGDKVLAKYEAQEEQEKVLAHKAESVYNQAKATAQTERKKAETQVKAAYDKAQTELAKAKVIYNQALAVLK